MTFLFLTLSSFFLNLAQIPYLDYYFFATVWSIGTFACVAFVIDFVYSFKGNN